MNNIPDKCLTCEHTTIQLEEVHKGYCKFEMESVVRCDRSGYRVGCVSADCNCVRNGITNDKEGD